MSEDIKCRNEFRIAKKLLSKSKKGDKIGFTCGRKHYKFMRDE